MLPIVGSQRAFSALRGKIALPVSQRLRIPVRLQPQVGRPFFNEQVSKRHRQHQHYQAQHRPCNPPVGCLKQVHSEGDQQQGTSGGAAGVYAHDHRPAAAEPPRQHRASGVDGGGAHGSGQHKTEHENQEEDVEGEAMQRRYNTNDRKTADDQLAAPSAVENPAHEGLSDAVDESAKGCRQ